MTWNLMMVCIALGVVLVNFIVFKVFISKKNIEIRALKFICLLFLIALIFTIFLPNVFWILSPFTESTQGKVLNSETGKGLPQVTILVAWRQNWRTPGGGSRPTYRNYRTTTDENGEFRIPKTVKALSLVLPPFAGADYGGISLLAYDFDHFFVITDVDEDHLKNVVLSTKSIKTDSEYFVNLKQIQKNIFYQVRVSDGSLLRKELFQLVPAYRIFEKKYPESKLHEEVFSKISSIYAQTNSKNEEYAFWQEYLQKYPTGEHAVYGKSRLAWLKHWVNRK